MALKDELEAVQQTVLEQLPKALAQRQAILVLAALMREVIGDRYDEYVNGFLEVVKQAKINDPDSSVAEAFESELRELLLEEE